MLTVKDLSLTLPTRSGLQAILDQISLTVAPGEVVAIVGESGSGKTMLARSLIGVLPVGAQIQGSLTVQIPDQLLDLTNPQHQRQVRGRHLAMIFQEPGSALNPLYSCGFHLVETLQTHHHLSPTQAQQRAVALLSEVQLPQPEQILHRYPHQLSGGQQQRLMVALALAGDPSLLIADEPTTSLDVTIQAEILQLLRHLQQQRQMAMLFITHDLGLVDQWAHRVVVMSAGRIVEQGSVETVFRDPQHPYTRGLLACRPPLEHVLSRLPTLDDFANPSGEGSLSSVPLSPQVLVERLATLHQQSPLIQVKHLKTYFPLRTGLWNQAAGEVKAVDDISFDVYPGETLGLVGESGSGKSTLGRSILRLVRPTSGQVIFDGDDLLRLSSQQWQRQRRHIQLIFQDPYNSLNPRMTVGEAIREPIQIHRLVASSTLQQQRVNELLQQVGLEPDAAARYPHQFSGGQRQRLCIARALAAQPRLLICDECVSALDVSIQAQILNLLKQLQEELGLTYVFISHDLSVVRFMSDRILVMYQGQGIEMADAESVYRHPQQDYTRRLWAAVPRLRA